LPILELNNMIVELSESMIRAKIIPERSIEDTLHISIATFHGMDYLLTWNCRHIANATIRWTIEDVCEKHDYTSPIICTPEELIGD